MSIVSLEEAKQHLRIESNVDDVLILRKIGAAESYVEGFVGAIADVAEDVPDALKEAVLCMVEYYFDAVSGAKERADELIMPYRQWSF